jgi:hypothetical protein
MKIRKKLFPLNFHGLLRDVAGWDIIGVLFAGVFSVSLQTIDLSCSCVGTSQFESLFR